MDPSGMALDHDVLAGGESGRDRLRVLARVMRDSTVSLLQRVGVGPDWTVLDVGCGGGDVVRELVALGSAVVGIDVDEAVLAIAADEARRDGLRSVELRLGDAAEPEERDIDRFDLVYARFLLTHLPDPESTLDALLRRVRPGGVVALEDIDVDAHFCWPPSAAFERYVQWYTAAHRAKGGDPVIGRRRWSPPEG